MQGYLLQLWVIVLLTSKGVACLDHVASPFLAVPYPAHALVLGCKRHGSFRIAFFGDPVGRKDLPSPRLTFPVA